MVVQIRTVTFTDLSPLSAMRKEHVDFTDNGNTSYLGAFVEDKIVGVVGWQMVGKRNLRYKTAFVLPQYRGKGIYKALFEAREQHCEAIFKEKITAFCTPLSLPMYLKSGFEVVRENKNGVKFVCKNVKNI